MKLTRNDVATAKSFFAGSEVSYESVLAVNTGVKLGEELPASVVGPFEFDDEEGEYLTTESGLELRVIETELYAAVENVANGEISFFALDDIE